jgi:hypothetical protein
VRNLLSSNLKRQGVVATISANPPPPLPRTVPAPPPPPSSVDDLFLRRSHHQSESKSLTVIPLWTGGRAMELMSNGSLPRVSISTKLYTWLRGTVTFIYRVKFYVFTIVLNYLYELIFSLLTNKFLSQFLCIMVMITWQLGR